MLNPFFLFVLLCLGGFWFYVLNLPVSESPDNTTVVFGRAITPEQRRLGMITGLISHRKLHIKINRLSSIVSRNHNFWRLRLVHYFWCKVSYVIHNHEKITSSHVFMFSTALSCAHGLLRDCPVNRDDDELGFLQGGGMDIEEQV